MGEPQSMLADPRLRPGPDVSCLDGGSGRVRVSDGEKRNACEAWSDARNVLAHADHDASPEPDDLERLATAAFLHGPVAIGYRRRSGKIGLPD